jgi:hypothetical protein
MNDRQLQQQVHSLLQWSHRTQRTINWLRFWVALLLVPPIVVLVVYLVAVR